MAATHKELKYKKAELLEWMCKAPLNGGSRNPEVPGAPSSSDLWESSDVPDAAENMQSQPSANDNVLSNPGQFPVRQHTVSFATTRIYTACGEKPGPKGV